MMLLRYLPTLISLAVGVYIALAWDSLYLQIGKYNGFLQSEYEVLAPPLVAEIEALRKRWDITGVSVAVVKQDPGQQYNDWRSDTFGLGEADGSGTPVDEDTLFSIASNTKLFVALSTGITVENETSQHGDKARFNWDTKMKDIIPDWQLMDPVASEQTDVIDLLSHRTGLARHDWAFEMATPVSEMISKMRYLRPSEEFRRTFQYNNLAHHVARTLPENLYGVSFTNYAQENILDKLNMLDTFWDIATMPPNGKRSQGFARRLQQVDACVDDEKRSGFSSACLGEKLNIGYFDPSLERTFGHWGVITNARDMSTWLKMLLLGGRSPYTNESVVPYSTIEKTTTAYSVPRESPDYDFPELGKITYGMAQRMSTYRGHRMIEHTGTIPGQTSRIMRVPGSGFGIAVMVNDHELGLHFVNVLTWRIMHYMLRLKPIDWERRLKPLLSQRLLGNVPPARAHNATPPSFTRSDIQGTYYNEAYGHITLCLASGLPNVNSKTPSECKRTLADHPFDLSPNIADDATSPRFIARFGQTSTMYLLFSHKNESSFIASMGMVFPQTDARMPSIYWYWDAIFAKDGMAFAGNAWGAGLGVKHSTPWAEGGLKKNAEVWFEKVVK